MATADQEAINSGIQISKLHQDVKTQKAKEKSKVGDLAIKKATLLGSMPTEGGTMGEGLIAGANRMAQSPHQNAWTGLIEGLMRGFGVGLKGKEAAEKRKQVEDALEVLNYAMEGREYLQGIQSQLAARKEEQKLLPSQQQITQAYENGTLEPTVKALLRQQGVDPNNVTFSSDGHSVFIKKGEQIIQKPVSDFFGQQDSQAFDFTNNIEKTNLVRSENKVIQGLAQENTALKSQNTSLTTLLSNIPGLDPQAIQALNAQAEAGKVIEQKKLGNETLTAEARGLSASASMKRANLDADLHDLNKEKLKADIDKIKSGDGKPDYDQMETQAYLRLHQLLSDNNNDPTNPTGAIGEGVQKVGSQLPLVGDWFGKGLAQKQEYNQILSDLKGLRFKKFGYSNKSEFDHIYTLKENMPRNEAIKFVKNELMKKGINPEIKTITLKKNGQTKTFPTQNYEEAKKLAEDTGYEVVK